MNSVSAERRADIAMMVIVLVWGFHFVVVKDGLAEMSPLLFQSIRFILAVPIFILIASRNWSMIHIPRHDLLKLVPMFLLGPVAYQLLFIFALKNTTSTNTSLLIATMPTWTALISIAAGKIQIRASLLVWIAFTLAGVSLVVVSRDGASLGMSQRDLLGSLLAIGAALVFSVYSILSKPFVDRYKFGIAIIAHWTTALSLTILALPELVKLTPSDVPVEIWPNLIYSGIAAGAGGYLIFNYALQKIGPARAAQYQNFTPLFATAFSILLLGEHLTTGIIIGGALTLFGVMNVRKRMQATVAVELAYPEPRFAGSGD